MSFLRRARKSLRRLLPRPHPNNLLLQPLPPGKFWFAIREEGYLGEADFDCHGLLVRSCVRTYLSGTFDTGFPPLRIPVVVDLIRTCALAKVEGIGSTTPGEV